MIFKKNFRSPLSLLETYSWSLVIAWTIIIGSFLLFGISQIRHVQREMVKKEARANFSKDQALRFWAATHGGVYVPVTKETPSNPFLSHVPERDIKTPSGKSLTLMNPAYMLRQTMERYEDLYGVRGHITSLKHFRPETAPDEWEKYALKKFEQEAQEIFEFTDIDGKPYFRLMSPMIAKKECLKCHGHQGYKVGDVRGGVSVSVPMAPYLANQKRQIIVYVISFAILWVLGFTGINLATRGLSRRIRERDKAEADLQKAHDGLELRVEKRTAELKGVNEQLRQEIEERNLVAEALRENKERLETLLHSLPFGILIMDSETHKIVEANPQAVLMIGAPAEQIIGSDSHKFICPAEKGACSVTDLGQDIDNSERELLTATGEKLPVLKTVIPIELDGRNCLIECFIDITDRKHAEAERVGREKLQSIIEMSGAVCHELNQPLQSISAYSELLMMDIDKENPSHEQIEKIKGQVDRMGEITKKLMRITKYETKGYLRGQIIDIDKASK